MAIPVEQKLYDIIQLLFEIIVRWPISKSFVELNDSIFCLFKCLQHKSLGTNDSKNPIQHFQTLCNLDEIVRSIGNNHSALYNIINKYCSSIIYKL